jgi:F-type H+-transporting ATPase subunit epsilon
MSEPIHLEVVTQERRVFAAQVSEIQFLTAERGYYGILPGHTPLVTPLGDGLLYYTQGDEKHWLTVFGGFAEVGPDHVTVLARRSETVDDIDPEEAHKALRAAQQTLEATKTPEEREAAQAALNICEVRLEAIGQSGR